MKTIILILFPFCSFSQIFSTNKDTLNFNTKSISIFFDSKYYSGQFETIENNLHDKIICFENESKCFFLSIFGYFNESYSKKITFKELLVIDGKKDFLIPKVKEKYRLNDVKIDKRQFYTKDSTSIKLSCLESNWNILSLNTKQRENNYDSLTLLNELIGTYQIKIFTHNKLDYSNNKIMGTIYITEAGITLECPIFNSNIIRASHLKDVDYNTPTPRNFYCKVNEGDGDYFNLNLSEDKSVGAISLQIGKLIKTTTFTILNKK
jgi:hypothetical protein